MTSWTLKSRASGIFLVSPATWLVAAHKLSLLLTLTSTCQVVRCQGDYLLFFPFVTSTSSPSYYRHVMVHRLCRHLLTTFSIVDPIYQKETRWNCFSSRRTFERFALLMTDVTHSLHLLLLLSFQCPQLDPTSHWGASTTATRGPPSRWTNCATSPETAPAATTRETYVVSKTACGLADIPASICGSKQARVWLAVLICH